jgi:hypothetical protein
MTIKQTAPGMTGVPNNKIDRTLTMAAIDEIKFASTTVRNGMSDVPVDPITIISATIKK